MKIECPECKDYSFSLREKGHLFMDDFIECKSCHCKFGLNPILRLFITIIFLSLFSFAILGGFYFFGIYLLIPVVVLFTGAIYFGAAYMVPLDKFKVGNV
jgi:hypothetical protein